MAYKKVKLWFDKALAELLAEKIQKHRKDFDESQFIKSVDNGVGDLEIKDRVELIADLLYDGLGKQYERDVKVLLNILGPENENETGMFTEYYWVMPIAKYVEKYGLNHFDLSMHALAEVTKRNTSEYAVRPYLEKDTKKTLKQMIKWSKDKNFHLRRLASEGVRPRLPWAPKLDIFIKQPELILPILNNLNNDSVKFVQKSVANCVNDIFKDNYEVGKQLIEDWNKSDISPERKWIIKHSLRKLKKDKDVWALKVLG